MAVTAQQSIGTVVSIRRRVVEIPTPINLVALMAKLRNVDTAHDLDGNGDETPMIEVRGEKLIVSYDLAPATTRAMEESW
jgi:hypothetical protein